MEIKKLSKEIEKDSQNRKHNIELKSDLVKKAQQYLAGESVAEKKNKFLHEMKDYKEILDLNTFLIQFLNELQKNLKSILSKNLTLDETEIKTQKQTESTLQNNEYAKQTLDELNSKLGEQKQIDESEKNKLPGINKVINELKNNLRDQNKLIKEILTPEFLKYIKKTDIERTKAELQACLVKELQEHNVVLSQLGQLSINNNIHYFEQDELKMEENIILMQRSMIAPKFSFKSGKFIAYQCPVQESLSIIKNGFRNLPIYNMNLFVGKTIRADFSSFYINQTTSSSGGDIFFMFPLDNIMRHNIYLLDDNTIKIITAEVDIKELQESKNIFKMLEKEIKNKFDAYLAQSRRLDDNFKEDWSDEAEGFIRQQFVEKWIMDAKDFKAKNDFDIIGLIAAMMCYSNRNFVPLHSKITEIEKMSYADLMTNIKNLNEFYGKVISDCKKLANAKKLEVKDCLILVPRKYALYFESQLEEPRPYIYYYDNPDNLFEIVLQQYATNDALLQPIPLRIFTEKDLKPLKSA